MCLLGIIVHNIAVMAASLVASGHQATNGLTAAGVATGLTFDGGTTVTWSLTCGAVTGMPEFASFDERINQRDTVRAPLVYPHFHVNPMAALGSLAVTRTAVYVVRARGG